MSNGNEKPGRPFGVTLAIIVSVIVFTIIPLAQVGLILSIEEFVREQNNTPILPADENTQQAFQSGGEFIGETNTSQLLSLIGISVGFFIIALFAWRGKPAYMRYVFMVAVLLQTAINVWLIVEPQIRASTQTSGGSLDSFFATLQCGQLTLVILVPIYVVWYLNRGPARAFYRGYYLTDEHHNPA